MTFRKVTKNNKIYLITVRFAAIFCAVSSLGLVFFLSDVFTYQENGLVFLYLFAGLTPFALLGLPVSIKRAY